MKRFLFGLAIAASVAAPWAGARPAAQANTGGCCDALATLEQGVMAQPDDLRAANDYRMAVVKIDKIEQFDRAIAFFQKVVTAHPTSSNAHLNYGFAYVDKIPAAGSI